MKSMIAPSAAPAGGHAAYQAKRDDYFSDIRRDYLDLLPADPLARILEVGCGAGSTGAAALSEGKCGRFCGVELCERAARQAAQRLSEVVVGDVEKIPLPWAGGSFDVLILSEVLEHLVDPWSVLRKLRPLLTTGALVLASSPNVCHYSIIRMLLRGQWELQDRGVMDRTHLRWFTFDSYREMFESAGFRVEHVGSLWPLGPRQRIINGLLLGKVRHLFAMQIGLRARCD